MNQFLYLILDLGSLSIPFIFSFHPKLQFYRYWKSLGISILLTMCIFIPWDAIFTINKIWGFNENYFLGLDILSLPLEEWLFFICIPYACVFIHMSLFKLNPKFKISIQPIKIITNVLIITFIALSAIFYDRWYTFINFLYASILLILVRIFKLPILQQYYLSFLIILIPFFIVNGILTGSFIKDEVVWYNNSENLGIRLVTIPVEDSIYAFSLVLTNLFLIDLFHKKDHLEIKD